MHEIKLPQSWPDIALNMSILIEILIELKQSKVEYETFLVFMKFNSLLISIENCALTGTILGIHSTVSMNTIV